MPPTLLFLPLSRVISKYLHLEDRLWALILIYPSFTIPFAVWLLMGFFKTIPQELEDAALVDGCSRFGSLVRIVFPISIPGILTVVIFTFSLVVNEFVYAITFISSSTNRTAHRRRADGSDPRRPVQLARDHGRDPDPEHSARARLQRVPQSVHRRIHRRSIPLRKGGCMTEQRLSRRELLKKAGAGAAAIGAAGAAAPFSFAGPLKYKGRWLKGNLSIIQWVHFVPAYDDWLDNTWVKTWGQQNDVQVSVEHINNTLLDTRAAAEVAAQSGHDLFMALHPMASYEDQVIDHAPIVQEIEAKVGPYGALAQASHLQPEDEEVLRGVGQLRTRPGRLAARPLERDRLRRPNTWDHVAKAAPKLKQLGHPIGIGQSQELDSNMALIAFLMCFGSFLQNADNHPTLNTKATVEAVNFMAKLYKNGEDSEIFGWNPASNNNYLYAGTASMILNAISATRTPESLNLPFSKDLWIWPIPSGPHGRLGLEHVMGCYSIWKFAQNKQNAQQFLADLCINYKQATLASQLYNFPSFPEAFPFDQIRKVAAADTHPPKGKYTILTTIAEKYTHNIGYPGTTNAAIDEIFSKYLIPQMFAQVSQGKLSAADSVRDTMSAAKNIYAKWRSRGKI